MGQYFKLVNLDKQEVVCPWCLGGGAKLWEWAANTQGAVLTLLLRKSDEGGGGDYYGYHKGGGEGQAIECPLSPIAGRWAGDRIALVGDYDSSHLWGKLPKLPQHHAPAGGGMECLHRTARPEVHRPHGLPYHVPHDCGSQESVGPQTEVTV